ncbi:MAG: tetratricopeptide repeat protein [Nitrospirae bacterium]|nr:tetratricopeptide repeat protein [Nitrospirota bacterium]
MIEQVIERYNSGNFKEAEEICKEIINTQPQNADAFHFLGLINFQLKNYNEAIEYIKKALNINPHFADAHNNLGTIYYNLGKLDKAFEHYQKAVELNPYFADAYNNIGVILQSIGQFHESISCFQKTLELVPEHAQAYNNLGNSLREIGEFEKALECFNHAISIKPDYLLAYYNKGNVLVYLGRTDEAIVAYDEALKIAPNFFTARWAKCISQLPFIYPDEASIYVYRKRYEDELLKLRDSISLETPYEIHMASEAVGSHQPFLLTCQGLNDRDLQKLYGEIVCKIMSKRYRQFTEMPVAFTNLNNEQMRIGIVSAFFHYHSVWKIPLKGWVENIDKNRFKLYGYYTRRIYDEVTEIAKKHFYKFVENIYSFEDLCQIIRDDNLHALIYPEIGMDTITLRLATLRLAPVQCTSLGHPDTTGLPTIDYYLSSKLMEPLDGDEHYTEKLIRLPNLGFYYSPIDITSENANREMFGLNSDSIVYLCSHALFTYLPQYDDIFPQIAKEVYNSKFVFISQFDIKNFVTEQFIMRLKKAFSSYKKEYEKHVVFLPHLTPERYFLLNSVSDIFLDTIGWSANNSTFEAINCNLPVVTLPGKLMRQRHSAGILRMMGLTETIASSVGEYVEVAVRLGKDKKWRQQISEKVNANKNRLYRDKECIKALEDFLENAVKNAIG